MARLTLRDRLATMLRGWAGALSPEPASTPLPVAPEQAGAERPPEHWQAAAQPLPNAHWLETVRQYAPQLLAGGDGVFDWSADDADAVKDDESLLSDTPAVTSVTLQRPVPTTVRVAQTSVPARPLRLVDVRTSAPPAAPPLRSGATSEPRRAVRLRVVAAETTVRKPVDADNVSVMPRGPRLRPHRGFRLPPRSSGRFAISERGAIERERVDSPDTRVISETAYSEPTPNNVQIRNFPNRHRPSTSSLHQGEGPEVRAAQPTQQARKTLHPTTIRTRPASAARMVMHSAHSHAERTTPPTPPPRQPDAPVRASQVSQPLQPPELPVITRRDFPASGVRVASHRFPTLLGDEREQATPDTRALERRQRLDAEQEGRAWNG